MLKLLNETNQRDRLDIELLKREEKLPEPWAEAKVRHSNNARRVEIQIATPITLTPRSIIR
jgi:hypothetical protein